MRKKLITTDSKTHAHIVVKAPKFIHTTTILKSLHLLKVSEQIEYKLLPLTNKGLTISQSSCFHNLISLHSPYNTCCSTVVTLS